MKYILGMDIGTTGCKVNIYNEELKSLASSYRSYDIISTCLGWAEEDPNIWWECIKDAIKECLSKSNVLPKDIACAGVSCTNGIVAVGKNGDSIYNAIMQIDNRTVSQAERINEIVGPDVIFRITGNRIAQGTFSAPIILWLKENLPDIYDKSYKFLSPTGFIVQKLTGKYSFDYTRASTTLLFDINNKIWSSEICTLLDISMDKLPNTYPSEEIAGYVSNSVSRETGLSEGMPVIAGVMDSVAACIGLGTTSISNPALIIGTVARLCIPHYMPDFDNRFLNSVFIDKVPFLSMTPVNAGGLSIRWFIKNFLEEEKKGLLKLEKDYYEYFEEKSSEIPPGSNSLIYLPYLVGERSPIWDSNARGVFFGANLKHTKYDFYRSILEGVAFAIKHNLETYTSKYKPDIKTITISGGGAKSKLWSKIFADILGIPIIVPNEVETETKGSAILAGYGTGLFDSLDRILPKKDVIVIEPNFNNTKVYGLLFNIYKHIYSNSITSFKELQEI